MSLSTLPLSYCTNVHPGRSVAEVEAGLDRYTVKAAAAYGQPLAAGLWLARPVVDELTKTPTGVRAFADRLRARGLTCHTLNAFPFGDFHSDRVKEQVYLPDWTTRNRLLYTQDCAAVLAELLPEGGEGSISTLPLSFKEFKRTKEFFNDVVGRLTEAAAFMRKIKDRTGRTIRLAIEPEPFCLLETTDETLAFFDQFRKAADRGKVLDVVTEHVGVCFDVCHQAVEFEDVADSIRRLAAAGVRVNKVHLSCALQLDDPANNATGRRALLRYVEQRYLHQTMAKLPDGRMARHVDLSPAFIGSPSHLFRSAPAWRVHFHVPVDAERLGPLGTTRFQLREAIAAVAALDYAPHLEVETYTWEVMPGRAKIDLAQGLARELTATSKLLAEASK